MGLVKPKLIVMTNSDPTVGFDGQQVTLQVIRLPQWEVSGGKLSIKERNFLEDHLHPQSIGELFFKENSEYGSGLF